MRAAMLASSVGAVGVRLVGPTGLKRPIRPELDLNEERNLASMSLDDVHFGPCPFEHTVSGLLQRKAGFLLLAPVGLQSDHDEGVTLYWC